jgi:nitrogen fixation NifU-like protein
MISDQVSEIYQQMILEHNKKPRNFRKIEAPTHQAEGFNPLCGDHFNVYLQINKEGTIEDVSFEGSGCAISKASASMMTTHLKGKASQSALEDLETFLALLKGKEPSNLESLGKLQVFSGIWKYPSRVKCASLAWHAIKNAINNHGTATTE